MEKKKILIVTRSFYPINSPRSFRATELAKEFARQGHNVTILTLKDSQFHIPFEKEHGIVIKNLGKPQWNSIELKGNKVSMVIRRGIKRFSNLLFQYPSIELMKLVKKELKYENDYTLLISIASPHTIHWGVAWARSKSHSIAKIWVADCGDPFMGQENDTFTPPFYFKYLEKWFCKKADYITVPTVGAIQAYYPEFRKKIKVIPQGFKFEDVKIITNDKSPNKDPIFAYAGGFIPGRRDPTELLSFLVQYDKSFTFHIYTNTPDLIKPFIQKSNGRIVLKEFIPRLQLLKELSEMDFVINFENAGTKQTPSKLIDYAIIQKPILSITTGQLDVKSVKEFLKGNYANQYIVNNPEQYRIENVSNEFLRLLE